MHSQSNSNLPEQDLEYGQMAINCRYFEPLPTVVRTLNSALESATELAEKIGAYPGRCAPRPPSSRASRPAGAPCGRRHIQGVYTVHNHVTAEHLPRGWAH